MSKKVLVGCPTYSGQEYCLDRFLAGLDAISYDSVEVVFVDNSDDDMYLKRLKDIKMAGKKITVLKDAISDTRISRIISSRNRVRDHFLKGDYSHLLFLDTDIIAPCDVIERLLALDTDVASGVYLGRVVIDGKLHLIPILYRHHDGGRVRTVTMTEAMNDDIFDISVCGLGCCLVRKTVVEKIRFRRFGNTSDSGEDTAFCLDVQGNGFEIKADTSVKCAHMGKNEVLVFPKKSKTTVTFG